MSNALYRAAEVSDAARIAEIYNYYVINSEATYAEEETPVEEMAAHIKTVQELECLPWLVAEENREIIGFGYASKYREKAAYRWDCELTIYLDIEATAKGVGSRFMELLIEAGKELGYINVFSKVNVPNPGSEALHRRFDFDIVGVEKSTGYKHGKWLDLCIYQKRINPSFEKPETPKTDWREAFARINK